MFHDEAQSENHLERQTPLPSQPALPDAEVQRKRMLIALGILLVALVAVVLKDGYFWFPPSPEVQEAAFRSKSKSAVAVPTSTPAAPAHEHKAKTAAPAPTEPPLSSTTERAALPPLQVEVVAGNRHINVPAKSNAIHLDVDSGATSSVSSAPAAAPNAPGGASAGDRVQLSPQTTESVSVSVPPDYPLLARQMKVQGAVRLQALISRDGTIQE